LENVGEYKCGQSTLEFTTKLKMVNSKPVLESTNQEPPSALHAIGVLLVRPNAHALHVWEKKKHAETQHKLNQFQLTMCL
jgi:hypothetical protein